MTLGRLRVGLSVAPVPPEHVIDQYRHAVQRVTCVCGWQGSSVGVMGGPSPWTLHVRQFKAGKR